MILVKPSWVIITHTPMPLSLIEQAGRTCYKSEIKHDEDFDFVRKLIKRGHLSVIEHASATVKLVVDRGVSHELVRHRLVSVSQESTRYCDYSKGHVKFVIPHWVDITTGEYTSMEGDLFVKESKSWIWAESMLKAERVYKTLRQEGWSPQQARSVLPNSLATEIVITANFREFMHIFSLRTASAAHPQMREIMIPLCQEFTKRWPAVFEGIYNE